MTVASVEHALAGLPVTFVHNPDFAEGLSTSLKVGIATVPGSADGAIICLGDMPHTSGKLIDRLVGTRTVGQGEPRHARAHARRARQRADRSVGGFA